MDRNEFWLILLLMGGRVSHRLKALSKDFLEQSHYNFETDAICLGAKLSHLKQVRLQKRALILATLKWLESENRSLVIYGSENYPLLLQHISSPPIGLFIEGSTKVLNETNLAMVGSRRCSRYGERCAQYFAQYIARQNIIINSGLAFGIDSICHQATLNYGRTIAVLGSGLAHIYPSQHQPLAKNIMEKGGALVSEFFPEAAPLPAHFPRRNRIISGMSLAVCLIEATLRSGSLITVQHALAQGREVFVLPGSIELDSLSGNFELLKQGACLVTQPFEILIHLGKDPLNNLLRAVQPNTPKVQNSELKLTGLLASYQPIFEILERDSVTNIDYLLAKTHYTRAEILEGLLELELSGYVEAVYGGYIKKIVD